MTVPHSVCAGLAAGTRIAAVGAVAGFVGLTILVLASASPLWLGVFIVAALAFAGTVLSGQVRRTLLCGYVIVAPVAVSKALATGAGVYAPALELTLADIVLGTLIIVCLIRAAAGERVGLVAIPGLWVVLAFFGWTWVSAVHADVTAHGILAALNATKYLFAFLVFATLIRDRDDLRWVLAAAGVGLALQLLMVGAQTATGSSLFLPGMKTTQSASMGYRLAFAVGEGVQAFRPSGFLQHPIFLADYLVLAMPAPVMLVLLGRRRIGGWAWGAALLLALAAALALILTLSRGGWISGGAALAFLLVVGVRHAVLGRRHLVGAVLLAVVGAGIVLAAFPAARYRLTHGDMRSGQSRVLMMEQAWRIVQHQPVFGTGLASYTRAAQSPEHLPSSFGRLDPEFRRSLLAGVVHNGYLVFWAERGLIGLCLALLVFGWYLVQCLRARVWPDVVYHALAIAFATSIVGQLVLYNFDHGYLDSRPGVIWMLLGITATMLRLEQEHRRTLQSAMVGSRYHRDA